MKEQKKKEVALSEEQRQIVSKNQKLVYHLLYKKKISSEQYEDLAQIGMIGLIKAAKTFDESKGNKFSTYASKCIMNEIYMFLRSSKKHQKEVAFEESITDENESSPLILLDAMQDEKTSSFAEAIFQTEELVKVLFILLNEIAFPKNYSIFLSSAGISQEEIGKILGVRRSAISRMQSRARNKVKSRLEEKNNDQKVEEQSFHVEIQDERIVITFYAKDTKSIKTVLLQFLFRAKEYPQIGEFEISYSNEKVMMWLLKEKEAFILLALLVKEIETIKSG